MQGLSPERGLQEKGTRITSICNSRCDVRMLAGAHQLSTATVMDAGEFPDFFPKYSSAKICLLLLLYELVAESQRQRRMRNWAIATDEGDKEESKGESGAWRKWKEQKENVGSEWKGDGLGSSLPGLYPLYCIFVNSVYICLAICGNSV